jgi:hypothetical protein
MRSMGFPSDSGLLQTGLLISRRVPRMVGHKRWGAYGKEIGLPFRASGGETDESCRIDSEGNALLSSQ